MNDQYYIVAWKPAAARLVRYHAIVQGKASITNGWKVAHQFASIVDACKVRDSIEGAWVEKVSRVKL